VYDKPGAEIYNSLNLMNKNRLKRRKKSRRQRKTARRKKKRIRRKGEIYMSKVRWAYETRDGCQT
jgi:hypothetical protein